MKYEVSISSNRVPMRSQSFFAPIGRKRTASQGGGEAADSEARCDRRGAAGRGDSETLQNHGGAARIAVDRWLVMGFEVL